MKRTAPLALASLALSVVLPQWSFAQMGAGTTTGNISLATNRSPFGVNPNAPTSSAGGGIGGFGGPGVSGVALVEYSKTNVLSQFNNSSTGGTGGTGGTGLGGSTTGGLGGMGTGGFGGMGMSGIGGMGMGGIGGLGGIGGMRGLGGIGGLGGLGGLGGNRNLGGARGGTQSGQIRAVVRPDAELQKSVKTATSEALQTRLTSLPLPERLRSINASVDAGVVVLQGTVSSDADKRLAERLLLLEPGVHSVRNEILVAGGN